MTQHGYDERSYEIRLIWKEHQWLYGLAGFLLGLIAFPAINALNRDVEGFLGDLAPEFIGIIFTVVFIDRLYQRREREREARELKERLIREMGSPINATALNAVRELRDHGWLQDGTLRGRDFRHADLTDADLHDADLRNTKFRKLRSANLQRANLSEADLWKADLRGADLPNVNLEKAILMYTNMRGAVLSGSNLKGIDAQRANFSEAQLQGSDLTSAFLVASRFQGAILWDVTYNGANLSDANLTSASVMSSDIFRQVAPKVDAGVILPDGTNPQHFSDLFRFSDPRHPYYWVPPTDVYYGPSDEEYD